MNQRKSRIRKIPEGDSPSQVGSQPNLPICPSSSNRHASQRKTTIIRESNEGFSRGDDEEDPLWGGIEKSHVVDHPQKLLKSLRSPKDSELEIFKDLEDMEIDISKQI